MEFACIHYSADTRLSFSFPFHLLTGEPGNEANVITAHDLDPMTIKINHLAREDISNDKYLGGAKKLQFL